jgi:hypothetical protein
VSDGEEKAEEVEVCFSIHSIQSSHRLSPPLIFYSPASKHNNFKGSIYMVFDYMDHDLTGLMERRQYNFSVPHVSWCAWDKK